MSFRPFKQVPRILFGKNVTSRIKELIPDDILETEGYFVVVIDSALDSSKYSRLLDNIVFIEYDANKSEPHTSDVNEIVSKLKSKGSKVKAIIGIGGGSTMDVAKSVSVLLNNEGAAEDFQGWDLVKRPGVFKIGVPTISGSGSEASRTAVLSSAIKKQGINSDYSMFDAVILDWENTISVPFETGFYTAMDTYIHCVESIDGTMINSLSRTYASEALKICESLFAVNYRENFSSDLYREKIMLASYFGGVSIVNSEVGICHALSYGLSMELGLRHGYANCLVFAVLDEYYCSYVNDFREVLRINNIILPSGITLDLDNAAFERMVEMTLRMERPLENALGKNWREKLTREKIIELYQKI